VIFTVKNVCLDAVNFQNGLDILQQANTTNQMPKKRQIQHNFICGKCDVICCKLSNWNMHLQSNIHIHGPKKRQTIFACKKCKKEYKSKGSVTRHEIKCESQFITIIDRLLNENVELRSFIVEQTNTIETIMTKNTENLNKTLEL